MSTLLEGAFVATRYLWWSRVDLTKSWTCISGDVLQGSSSVKWITPEHTGVHALLMVIVRFTWRSKSPWWWATWFSCVVTLSGRWWQMEAVINSGVSKGSSTKLPWAVRTDEQDKIPHIKCMYMSALSLFWHWLWHRLTVCSDSYIVGIVVAVCRVCGFAVAACVHLRLRVIHISSPHSKLGSPFFVVSVSDLWQISIEISKTNTNTCVKLYL